MIFLVLFECGIEIHGVDRHQSMRRPMPADSRQVDERSDATPREPEEALIHFRHGRRGISGGLRPIDVRQSEGRGEADDSPVVPLTMILSNATGGAGGSGSLFTATGVGGNGGAATASAITTTSGASGTVSAKSTATGGAGGGGPFRHWTAGETAEMQPPQLWRSAAAAQSTCRPAQSAATGVTRRRGRLGPAIERRDRSGCLRRILHWPSHCSRIGDRRKRRYQV